jgi:hypothetical protein
MLGSGTAADLRGHGSFYDGAGQIEKHAFFKRANLLKLTVDLIFCDRTTARFSIDEWG